MSTDAILRIERLSKAFRRYKHKPSIVRNLLLGAAGRTAEPTRRWILSEVDFTVERGEAIGLVGQNGAGKSTLLRLIAGTLIPTAGSVRTRGRVTPLLGVGGGLQPELTGREYLQIMAVLLGLDSARSPSTMAEIAEFAELTDFLDTPLRYFSSGMLSRLGVALALHGEPDVLLVDEALSVGDASFREKCAAQLEQARERGVTFILASHDSGLLRRMCTRVLWLHDSRLHRDGPAGAILDEYDASQNPTASPRA